MNEYISVFGLVFIAVLLALVVSGSITKKSFHVGLPDQ